MLLIFSTPVLIRNMWQLKAVVSLHWCIICGVPFKDPCTSLSYVFSARKKCIKMNKMTTKSSQDKK